MTIKKAPCIGGIFAVVVVYNKPPLDCPGLTTLLASAAALPKHAPHVRILVADNTPGGQQIEALPFPVQSQAYVENPGLARPYNDALMAAEREGLDWLLTLDQDTCLPLSFLSNIVQAIREYQDDPKIAAIVPRIVDRGRIISPFRFLGGFLPYVLPAGMSGVAGTHISALNSASLFRVRALRELGGYDEHFPLHNSDTRMYQQINAAGKCVAIADHVTVPHELSILDRENRMSPDRYRHMLFDECAFWDRHMGFAGRAERLIRLVVRFGKGVIKGEAAAYQRVTQQEILRRLLTSKKTRMLSYAIQGGR